ncbi:MAG: TonB family protein [Victivallales bacterium]|nr:TonB family protein [Victivallales bacterium]
MKRFSSERLTLLCCGAGSLVLLALPLAWSAWRTPLPLAMHSSVAKPPIQIRLTGVSQEKPSRKPDGQASDEPLTNAVTLRHLTKSAVMFDDLTPPVEAILATLPADIRSLDTRRTASVSEGQAADENASQVAIIELEMENGYGSTDVSAGILSEGDADTPPQLLVPLEPVYPERARLRNITGEVRMEFVVDSRGRANEVVILDATPSGYFEEAARTAISRARFIPARKDGQAVSCRHCVTIYFQLKD